MLGGSARSMATTSIKHHQLVLRSSHTLGCGSKPCTPGEHHNWWQMDVHPPQNGIAIGYAPWPHKRTKPSRWLTRLRLLTRSGSPLWQPGHSFTSKKKNKNTPWTLGCASTPSFRKLPFGCGSKIWKPQNGWPW